MWSSIRRYVEAKRTKKDVKKLERKLILIIDEEEIQKLKAMIKLRKALWSKDFYSYFDKKSI